MESPGCELLIRVKDAKPEIGDPAHDSKIERRGDVVEACKIDWPWGDCELGGPTYEHTEAERVRDTEREAYLAGIIARSGSRAETPVLYKTVVKFKERRPIAQHVNGNHPFWRIVRFPNVRLTVAESLLHTENRTEPHQPYTHLQHRGFALNIDAFPESVKAFIADDTRTIPVFEWDIAEPAFRALIYQRPPIPYEFGP